MTMPKFYRLGERPLTPWGDYGHILQHGMAGRLQRHEGLLQLERTGPYMPPITFPGIGDVVLTSGGKALLKRSGLTGFAFQPVIKSRIVDLPWHEWDLTSEYPPELPESGEPEDYILDREPDAVIAEQLGNVWELVVPITATISRPRRIVDCFRELYIELSSWDGTDVFRGDGYGSSLVTERAKRWLEDELGNYTAFTEFNCK